MSIEHAFLASIVAAFEAQKQSAEKAIVQLVDEKLHVPLDANTNSVALARFLAKDQWRTITIPRGGSNAFNAALRDNPPRS